MTTGVQLLALARTRIGETYDFVCVPKNNHNWHGPWDCAEFMSWLVYQVGGFLYGCFDDNGNPATVEAYTGAWQADSQRLGILVRVQEAAGTAGAILLRYPPAPGSMGHIVVSDGAGGTVEAMGKAYGVRAATVNGRRWDAGIFLPDFTYDEANTLIEYVPPTVLYAIDQPGMKKGVIKTIQRTLKALGFDPGPIDGDYGHNTAVAVAAFQAFKGLVVDGQIGPQTARRLKVDISI